MPRELADSVSGAMELQGAVAVTSQDAASSGAMPPGWEGGVYEPRPGEMPLWSSVEVKGLFNRETSRDEVLESVGSIDGIGNPERFHWREGRDPAWPRAWMDHFKPMRFGKRLWIVPGGMSAPTRRDDTVIHIDPGLAFGTGAHATTALCLDWLDGADLSGKVVVDYGCGSGVLAVAAALKGARRVVAVDNDLQALEATQSNATINNVAGQIVICLPQHFDAILADTLRGAEGADILICNILANPLVELAPRLTAAVRPRGTLVLSGVLENQVERVSLAYEPAFGKLKVSRRDGWARLSGKRRAR